MKAKVLITGASGLLGRSVLKYFENVYKTGNDYLELECLGLCHSRVKNNLKQCDLTNYEQTNEIINEFKPNVIIHCAAERKVENVENNYEKTVRLNINSTRNLSDLAAKLGIFFIYISTDYVFDGTKPPYKTDDKPNPLNKYGLTKLNGEIETFESSKDHCVVRIPVLYSNDLETLDESAISVFLPSIKDSNVTCKMDNAQIRYPLHTIDAARFLYKITEKHLKGDANIKGIFHVSGSERLTKYEMSILIADLFNLPKSHIVPDYSSLNAVPQLRPIDATLSTSESYRILDNFKTIMKFSESIKEALEPFINN